MSLKHNKESSAAFSLDQMVRADKLQLLYEQSFPAIFGSLFSAGLLVVILWSAQEASILKFWFSILSVSTVVRIILFVQYRKIAPKGDALLAWERPYFITLILSSTIWGLGAVYILPTDSVALQVLVYSFLVGMAGGAISVYSANRVMVLVTIALVLFPVTIWFVLQWNLLGIIIGLATILYFVSVVRAGKVLSIALHRSFKLTHELNEAKEIAEKLASTDELTGLGNRRTFYDRGQLSYDLCQRNGKQLAMIVIDIDYFKDINDTYGHAVGDETLRSIGAVLLKAIRKSDICSRIGGEEFGILLHVESLKEAVQIAEKLRLLIAGIDLKSGRKSLNVTASFGIAMGEENLELLFKHADIALYEAKAAGRNRVASYSV